MGVILGQIGMSHLSLIWYLILLRSPNWSRSSTWSPLLSTLPNPLWIVYMPAKLALNSLGQAPGNIGSSPFAYPRFPGAFNVASAENVCSG